MLEREEINYQNNISGAFSELDYKFPNYITITITITK